MNKKIKTLSIVIFAVACMVFGALAVNAASSSGSSTGKHNHMWGKWTVKKAATCTATGTKTRRCSICNKTETATIAKTAHNYAVSSNTVSCKKCKKVLMKGPFYKGKTFKLTDAQIKTIAKYVQWEEGTNNTGIQAFTSMIVNNYTKNTQGYKNLEAFIKNSSLSGFAFKHFLPNINSVKPTQDAIDSVKWVVVNGYRTLPAKVIYCVTPREVSAIFNNGKTVKKPTANVSKIRIFDEFMTYFKTVNGIYYCY